MKPELARLREFAKRYTAAWCSQDAASVAAHYAPGGSLAINDDTPAVGRRAIVESAQCFMTAFPDLRLLMDDVVLQVDRVVFHWTLTGTSARPDGTARRVRISGFEVWKIGEDGLIAESQGHFDSASYRQQLERGAEESE